MNMRIVASPPSFGWASAIKRRATSSGSSFLSFCRISTLLPAKSLFDHLEAGDSIEQFLEGFPSVKREQVIALLEDSKAHVLAAR